MTMPLAFGTDGIRAHANEYPFTSCALDALGKAIAQWAIEKYDTKNPVVLIGHDTRISCSRIKKDIIFGLAHFNLNIVDGGVMPTPMVCQLIKDSPRFHFGIVISASHNPYYDNGIKLFDSKMSKLSIEDEKNIIAYFHASYSEEKDFSSQPQKNVNVETWTTAVQDYEKKIASYFPSNFLCGKKIVIDCAHGATSHIAPDLFLKFGAEVIAIAQEPTGININEKCGTLYPDYIQKAVLAHNAHIGFAFDGDGDRLVAVGQSGIIKNGDDILFLLLTLPEYATTSTVVGTIMSNKGFEQALNKSNKKLIRTNVGDKYVAESLVANNLSLGGELSGHTIIKDYMTTSDGIFVALKIAEAAFIHNNWLLETFDAFPQILLNIPVNNKKDLTKHPFLDIITTYEKQLPSGRILVRYSGTEKILRVMTEAQSQEHAFSVAQALANELQHELAKI
jgi:phosphoglucosamine mutase